MTGTIRHWLGIAGVVCAVALYGSTAIAQESRGSIAGLIVDSSGGALPGVTVTVVNNGTNSTTSLVTNDTGQYAALFLLPGSYRVTAELSGFQKQGSSHRAGPRRRASAARRHVAAGERARSRCWSWPTRSQLETSTASIGQVITSKLISEIPLGDGTAYGLTRLVAVRHLQRVGTRCSGRWTTNNLRGAVVTGTLNSEFTIHGSSNVVSQARVGISDPLRRHRGVQGRDRRQRRSNRPHRRRRREPGAQERHHLAPRCRVVQQPRRLTVGGSVCVQPHGTGKPPRDYNRFNGTVTGPIFRNRTFFMSVREAAGRYVEAVTHSVPTSVCGSGDLFGTAGAGVQLYDLVTARLVDGVVVRDRFRADLSGRPTHSSRATCWGYLRGEC